MTITKLRILAILIFGFIYQTVWAQAEDSSGVGSATGIIVYTALQSGAPYSFSLHDVTYSVIEQASITTPSVYLYEVVRPSHYPYERHLVVPSIITHGVYTLIPKRLSDACFQQTGIKSVDLRAEIGVIPQNAFLYCDNLESVEFHGNSPHFIEKAAFKGCTKLNKIAFPAQLKYIGDNAFDECRALSSLHLPKDLAYLGPYAFNYCTSLTSLSFDSGHFRVIPTHCFYNTEKLQSVRIPEGVSELGQSSFEYSGLKEIYLPSTLKLINHYALKSTPLQDIYLRASQPPIVGDGFMRSDCNRIRVHVPSSAVSAYKNNTFWSNFPNIIGDL